MGIDTAGGEKYQNLVSRQLDEGGYTFLHRVFNTNRTTGEPVTINTGKLHIQYKHEPGHTTFEEGLTLIDGQEDEESLSRFMEVASSFDLSVAIQQASTTNHTPKKSWASVILPWKK